MTALSGQTIVTIAGTEVQLAADQIVNSQVMLKALPTNTGLVYVGNGTGTLTAANGMPLTAGESVVLGPVINLSSIWVDSSVNSEGIAWLVLAVPGNEAVRPGLEALVTRVRKMIHDPAGTAQIHTDAEICAALDRYRQVVVRLALEGNLGNTEYRASLGDWGEWSMTDSNLNALTPAVSSPEGGFWQFANAQTSGVFMSGATYDVYAAAADLLEEQAVLHMGEIDFSADGASFTASQMLKNPLTIAAMYRRRARGGLAVILRSDVNI